MLLHEFLHGSGRNPYGQRVGFDLAGHNGIGPDPAEIADFRPADDGRLGADVNAFADLHAREDVLGPGIQVEMVFVRLGMDVLSVQDRAVFAEDRVLADLDVLTAVDHAPDAEPARFLEVEPSRDVGHAFGSDLAPIPQEEFAVAQFDVNPLSEVGTPTQGDLISPSLERNPHALSDPAARREAHFELGPRSESLQAKPGHQGQPAPGIQRARKSKHNSPLFTSAHPAKGLKRSQRSSGQKGIRNRPG